MSILKCICEEILKEAVHAKPEPWNLLAFRTTNKMARALLVMEEALVDLRTGIYHTSRVTSISIAALTKANEIMEGK